MQTTISKTHLVRCHAAWAHFDYQLAVDWAIDLLRSGTESENLLILASLVPRVDSYEASKYTSAALRDLKLTEYDEETAMRVRIQRHVSCIVAGVDVREHLYALYRIAMETQIRDDVRVFYFLYHGWKELDEFGTDLYYGTTKDTVLADVTKEAEWWMANHAISLDG